MPKYPWIEFPLLGIAILGPLLVIGLRLSIKKKVTKKKVTDTNDTITEGPMGIGVRMIQLIALLILIPTIAVLAFEGNLTGEGTGTLLGAIVGYALGGVTAPVPKEK